jgi:hypothetical protein
LNDTVTFFGVLLLHALDDVDPAGDVVPLGQDVLP